MAVGSSRCDAACRTRPELKEPAFGRTTRDDVTSKAGAGVAARLGNASALHLNHTGKKGGGLMVCKTVA